jgi:hypothetical protein
MNTTDSEKTWEPIQTEPAKGVPVEVRTDVQMVTFETTFDGTCFTTLRFNLKIPKAFVASWREIRHAEQELNRKIE